MGRGARGGVGRWTRYGTAKKFLGGGIITHKKEGHMEKVH